MLGFQYKTIYSWGVILTLIIPRHYYLGCHRSPRKCVVLLLELFLISCIFWKLLASLPWHSWLFLISSSNKLPFRAAPLYPCCKTKPLSPHRQVYILYGWLTAVGMYVFWKRNLVIQIKPVYWKQEDNFSKSALHDAPNSPGYLP